MLFLKIAVPSVLAVAVACKFYFATMVFDALVADTGKPAPLVASTTLLDTFAAEPVEHVSLDNLKFDNFSLYRTATCFTAADASDAIKKVAQELSAVPPSVREDLSSRAIADPCTASEHQTSVEGSHEVAYIYWKLECGTDPTAYNMCISIAGATVVLSEIPSGSIVERENRIVGYEPCKCSAFNLVCRECPIVETTEHVRQVLRRPLLTLGQHSVLAKALRSKAIEHARETIAHEGLTPALLPGTRAPNTASVRTTR